jgi:hypothetical protein
MITTLPTSLDATLECSNTTGIDAALLLIPAATDNCDASPTISLSSDVTTPGTCPQEYARVKTWRFRDDCGNVSGTFTQTVAVQDNTPPMITTCRLHWMHPLSAATRQELTQRQVVLLISAAKAYYQVMLPPTFYSAVMQHQTI